MNAVFVQQTMKIVSWPHICTQLEIRQMCGASFRLTRMWLLVMSDGIAMRRVFVFIVRLGVQLKNMQGFGQVLFWHVLAP